MFSSNFKLECTLKIEASINVPVVNYHIRRGSMHMLRYTMENAIRCIVLDTDLEAATFFKKVGYIDGFTVKGEEVTMFRKGFITTAAANGAPVQTMIKVEVKHDDIVLTELEVQKFAAMYEFDKATGIMGKVINMTSDFLKAA